METIEIGAVDPETGGTAERTLGEAIVRALRPSAVIAAWREQLLAGPQSDLAVARGISEFVADAAAPRVSVGDVLSQALVASLLGGRLDLDEAYGAAGADMQVVVRDALAKALRPAALAATSQLGDLLRASDEMERRYEMALTRMGWWFPPGMTPRAFRYAGELAERSDRVGLRRFMVKLARGPQFGRMVQDWWNVESFRRRRRFIADGLQDHHAGRYRVSIPTLLPVIEGIAVEELAPSSAATNPKAAVAGAVQAYDCVMGSAIVDTITLLWGHHDFASTPSGCRTLNRHLILHGRSTGYGTEANSVKVMFALDQLHSLVEAKTSASPDRPSAS